MKLRLERLAVSGITLVEILMSISCGLMILAAVLVAGVALQRSFMAVQGYSIAEGDQLRVQDYIALDCRRAIGAAVDTTTNTLTLTVPNYYDASGNPVNPSYDANGAIKYGAGSSTIKYYPGNTGNFIREVNGLAKAIATNVDSFTVDPQDLTSSVTCKVTFAPRFVYLPGPGPVNGTTVFSNTFLRNAVARQ